MSRRHGFALIELIIAFSLFLILFSFLVPWVEYVRRGASNAQARQNLKMLGLACHNHNDVWGNLPPIVGERGDAFGTIHFHLLPYVDQNGLWKSAAGSVWKNGVLGTSLTVFLDDRDGTGGPDHKFQDWLATTNFAANWLAFKTGKNRIPVSFPDGCSNTLIWAERYQVCNRTPTAWGYAALSTWTPMFGYYSQGKFQSMPNQADCDPTLPQSIASPAILVALADASVRAVAPSVSPETWWFATDPADGNVLGDDWND